MKFLLRALILATPLFLGACSDDDEPVIPEDADDNFVTSVVMTVDGTSYSAEIANNTITMTVPYTISLDNAQVTFAYTSSATIIPDPTTITDWDTERTFRVISYNGAINDYTYKVIKDEIRHEGDVELKTNEEVATFVATGTTIIKGNLIIGSDAENAEALTDITALSLLKEVEGNIIIRNSFSGADMTGLDNITSIGGLQIGSEDEYANNTTLQMVSMRSLEQVAGDIVVRNNHIVYVQFDNLTNINGNIVVHTSSLQSLVLPKLNAVTGDFDIQGITTDNEAGGEITSLEIPELVSVDGQLGINNLGKLTSLTFPKLQKAGSIYFVSIPTQLETLSLPLLSVVNGDLNLTSNYISTDAFTSTGNNKLLKINGLQDLTIVKGTLTISKFQVLTELPDWSKLTQLGGLTLSRLLEYYNHTLDLSKVNFEAFDNIEPTISITNGTIFSEIITQEDLSHVNMEIAPDGITGSGLGIHPKLNFKSINNFTYTSSTMSDDPEFQFEKVYGNLNISRGLKNGVSAPNLISVDGYLMLKTIMPPTVSFPKLEIVGGQFYIEGNLNGTGTPTYDFSNLKNVGCSANPQYYKEGEDNNKMLYGSLDIMAINKDIQFPKLEHVGGVGMTVRAVKSISCPTLHTIDGTLCAASATAITSFDMPKLKTLTGVRFYRLTKFTDYTMFSSFIQDGQINEEHWYINSCGYNPTYQDMKDGKYTAE